MSKRKSDTIIVRCYNNYTDASGTFKQDSITLFLAKDKETSVYIICPAVVTIIWVLIDDHDEKIDYEHFHTPFILTVNEALSKVRNLNQRILFLRVRCFLI